MQRASSRIPVIACALILHLGLLDASAADPATGFARRQLEQMCEDRPDMAGILQPGDGLYERIERFLDIGDPKTRIYWVPLEPTSGFFAQSGPKDSLFPSQVRVSSSPELTGEDRWLCFIFELHNIDNSENFHKLTNSLWQGTITAEAYADGFLLLELAAEVRTKKFLQRYVPCSHKLASSRTYQHYMSLGDEVPTQISVTDRTRCRPNLELYRKWAKDATELRSLYLPK